MAFGNGGDCSLTSYGLPPGPFLSNISIRADFALDVPIAPRAGNGLGPDHDVLVGLGQPKQDGHGIIVLRPTQGRYPHQPSFGVLVFIDDLTEDADRLGAPLLSDIRQDRAEDALGLHILDKFEKDAVTRFGSFCRQGDGRHFGHAFILIVGGQIEQDPVGLITAIVGYGQQSDLPEDAVPPRGQDILEQSQGFRGSLSR